MEENIVSNAFTSVTLYPPITNEQPSSVSTLENQQSSANTSKIIEFKTQSIYRFVDYSFL